MRKNMSSWNKNVGLLSGTYKKNRTLEKPPSYRRNSLSLKAANPNNPPEFVGTGSGESPGDWMDYLPLRSLIRDQHPPALLQVELFAS
ncbi:hypothetical protein DDZ16_09045 [Marinilabilia rubra]|uniref:Uncharacterized protein n=1 Tax=Marinilabilia rubra TaxID=2162893 RepID=A0A2U2B938_9BACT|nr:hypothetical protein DDZ16_09045 [Marinilabilia rubra]